MFLSGDILEAVQWTAFLYRIRTVSCLSFGDMKILIVEDEIDLAQSMATYLKGENYLCELAPDCRTALDKIDLYDYDCILLDISL